MALSDDKVYTNAAGGTLLDTPAANDRNFVFEKLYAKDLSNKNEEIKDLNQEIVFLQSTMHDLYADVAILEGNIDTIFAKDIPYSEASAYSTGDCVYKESEGKYYEAKHDITAGTTWNPSDWNSQEEKEELTRQYVVNWYTGSNE